MFLPMFKNYSWATSLQLKKWFSAGVRFAILFIIWLILSGQFDFFHVGMGVLCCLLVEIMVGRSMTIGFNPRALPAIMRFLGMYLPWLIGQIVIANLQMLYISFSPNLKAKINPQIIKFTTQIQSPTGRYIFANSITLTPGTTTVYASQYGEFTVHALNSSFARALPGKMETMILRMLGETHG